MKTFARIIAALVLSFLTVPVFSGDLSSLDESWARYNEVFRSPRDVFFEIKTEIKDKDEALRLEQTAQMLRSIPSVEEAFVVIPNSIHEQERAIIFQLVNASPVEFGAWLEKLQPARVRQSMRDFVKCLKAGPIDPANRKMACPSDPLGLKSFSAIPGNTPVFKQPIATGIFVRLRDNPSADQNPWQWRDLALSLEQQIHRQYDSMGWTPTVTRNQYVPPSTPAAESLVICFWFAVSLVGASAFFCFFRRMGPFLALLAWLALSNLLLGRLELFLPHFLHPLLFPAALSLTLFWALLVFSRANSGQTHEAFQDSRAQSIALLCAGGLGLVLFELTHLNAYPSLGLFLVAIPLGLFGVSFLLRAGWGQSDGGEPPTPLFSSVLALLARRKKSIMFLLLVALAIPLTLQKLKTSAQQSHLQTSNQGVWSLLPDHAWTDQTNCLLTEGSNWGEIIYQLGAQRFAFSHARDERLVDRYWSPSSWVPRPIWQRSNAADFLKKRNVVVLEKIARQEGLPQVDLDSIIDYLNKVGEVCLSLTQDEKAEWVLSAEPTALGLRFRHWMHADPDSITVLSYCFVRPPTSQETLMPWISEAVRPFGVEIRWVAPQLLESAAIRDALARVASIAAVCLVAFLCLSRGRELMSLPRLILATCFFPASWLLNIVALGWEWTGSGLWVWTWVAIWHTSLCVVWFTRRSAQPEKTSEALPASFITGLTVLSMAWLWGESGKSESYAVLLGTGLFWSLAWCLLLAPPRRSA